MDVYVLAPARSQEAVEVFRRRWLDGFEQAADEYEFPQYATSPRHVYDSPWLLIDDLLREPHQPHALYWRNPDDSAEVANAMLFFTTDGGLVAGLTVHDENPATLTRYLQQLAESMDAKYGYVAWEEPPPERSSEFIARASEAMPPRLAKGRLEPTSG
jgi:hypothetical protein